MNGGEPTLPAFLVLWSVLYKQTKITGKLFLYTNSITSSLQQLTRKQFIKSILSTIEEKITCNLTYQQYMWCGGMWWTSKFFTFTVTEKHFQLNGGVFGDTTTYLYKETQKLIE